MASSGSRQDGKAKPEMFFERPSHPDSPTVGPLRINKGDSRSPEPDIRPGAFPLPPGASSSPAPLPYPDDRPRPQAKPTTSRTPGERRGSASRPAAEASDPSRAGIPDVPAALKPHQGRDAGPGLAERRGNAPKPLPDSPGPDAPDKEGLFQKAPRRDGAKVPDTLRPARGGDVNPFPDYHQQYWPPPGSVENQSKLNVPNPSGVNRLGSTSSVSTTKAQRGSPPPPETPVIPPEHAPGGGIEARFAASGIAGSSTLNNLQAQNASAQQRANQYPKPGASDQRPEALQRRWTPTEQPGSQPHGPPTVYQGSGQVSSPPLQAPTPQGRNGAPQAQQPGRVPADPTALEQDMQRIHVSASPPPAYSPSGSGAQGYPNEKQQQPGRGPAQAAAVAPGARVAGAGVQGGAPQPQSAHPDHPAFANDARPEGGASPTPATAPAPSQQNAQQPSPTPANAGPSSPPPLPEGWIAHLDQNSGHYYYIHLPTQSTQWEFPKGPTPLNLNEPASPVGSVSYHNPLASPGLSVMGGKPLASPGMQPGTPGYQESIISQTPTVTGFTGPPPSSGVDMYKIAPTNGVYFGPYLRYTNMDIERGVWLGSILLVTDAPQPPTIHIHQSVDLSPNPRQLKSQSISVHQRWTFYRYDIDLKMEEEGSSKWTYAITSHLGCTRYEFLVAGRHETNWRFIATSGNDFGLNVNANERTRIGGVGYMWKDVMQKHVECGGFHTQLGLGDQIYADRLWKEVPALKQWLAISGKENRKSASWTAQHEEDVSHAYFHYYTSHFDQPFLREAFAQIPYVLQIDDHDM